MSDCFKGDGENRELNNHMGLEKSQHQLCFIRQRHCGDPVREAAMAAGVSTRGRTHPPGFQPKGAERSVQLNDESGSDVSTPSSSGGSQIEDAVMGDRGPFDFANSGDCSRLHNLWKLPQEPGESRAPHDQWQSDQELVDQNVFAHAISMLPQIVNTRLENGRHCVPFYYKASTDSNNSCCRGYDTGRVLQEPTGDFQTEINVDDAGRNTHFTVEEFLSYFSPSVDSQSCPKKLIEPQTTETGSTGYKHCHSGSPNSMHQYGSMQDKLTDYYQNPYPSTSSMESSSAEQREHGYMHWCQNDNHRVLSPGSNTVDPPSTSHLKYHESQGERKIFKPSPTNISTRSLTHQITSNNYDSSLYNDTVCGIAPTKKQAERKTASWFKGKNLTSPRRIPVRSGLMSDKAGQQSLKTPVQANHTQQINYSLPLSCTCIHQSSFGLDPSGLSFLQLIRGQSSVMNNAYGNGIYQLFPISDTPALSRPLESTIHKPHQGDYFGMRNDFSSVSYQMFQNNSSTVICTSSSISHQPLQQSHASRAPDGGSAYKLFDDSLSGINHAFGNSSQHVHDLQYGGRQIGHGFPTCELVEDLTMPPPSYSPSIAPWQDSHLMYITQALETRILFRVVDPKAPDGPILREGGSSRCSPLPPTPPSTILCLPHQHLEFRRFLEQHALDDQLFSVGLYHGQPEGCWPWWPLVAGDTWQDVNGASWCPPSPPSPSTVGSPQFNGAPKELHRVITRAEFSQVWWVALTRPGLDPQRLRLVVLVYDALSLYPWTPVNRVTPLLVAVFMVDRELVRYLLLEGADPDGGLLFGLTALGLAMAAKRVDVASLLERAGADVGRKDGRGRRALHYLLAPQPPMPVLHFYFWRPADAKKYSTLAAGRY